MPKLKTYDSLMRIFSLKEGEFKLLILSFSFIFVLFSSYSLLRPIRDALGLSGGDDELKWLFLGTFLACIASSLALMWLSTRIKRRFYIDFVLVFFGLNLLAFYVAMSLIEPQSSEFIWLCRIFYVWVSVFNLFVFSSAWSLLSDIFSKEASLRLFGIIAAGASLGSIAGSASVRYLVEHIGTSSFILASMILLCLALALKHAMISDIFKHAQVAHSRNPQTSQTASQNPQPSQNPLERFDKTIGAKNPFVGFSLIAKSPYLLALCAFVLLLTAVSTFLYMEQMRIIKETFSSREERVAVFATIDLVVQSLSLFIQIFLTAKIAKFFSLSALLSTLGFVISIGFVVLCFTHPAFLPLAVVMSMRRVGEYALVKPGREMLFVPLSSDEKYKVKNFIDTVVYRGGDALSAQVESALFSLGISVVLLVGAGISFVWGILGVFLGRKYQQKDEQTS